MNNLLFKIKPYGAGLGILAFGIIAFFIVQGNPLKDLQLMSRGITVQGVATDVNDFEDREDNGNLTRYFFIKYEFTTEVGEKISGVVEVPGNSIDKGFRTGQALEIQYLTEAPKHHRVTALASTTITSWFLKNLIFGLLAIVPGSYMLFRSYRSQQKRQ